MYELLIETSFHASHALLLRGEREQPHWHDWQVVVRYAGEKLDEDGLIADFHALEKHLAAVLEPLRERSLNDCAQFAGINPSAEQVARHIADALVARHDEPLCRVRDVTVSEAPGCRARYTLPTR